MKKRLIAIASELKAHAPFTAFGALTGIACMLLLRNTDRTTAYRLFQLFHPGHVLLSALATASLFKLRQGTKHFLTVAIVGYFGSIGVATMSDCVLPFFGESILGVAVPVHGGMHEGETAHDPDSETTPKHSEQASDEAHHDDHHGLHLGFIEEWYIVNPAALLGVLIAYFLPHTKFSHAGHVLVSTWASSFHMLMNTESAITPVILVGMFIVLFVAVLLPCCISDIAFPWFFIKSSDDLPAHCGCGHSHK